MKNVMLMISKVQSGGGTLLTSILVISVLGVLLFLILNRNQKLKYIKKITSVALILTMLLLPFTNLLNAKAESTTVNVDDNKKVVNVTNLIVNNAGKDSFKAYKVLDAFYDSNTNQMSYEFTTQFSSFLNSYDDDNIKNLQVSDYLEYGYDERDTSITEEQKNTKQQEFDNLAVKFAKYVRKQQELNTPLSGVYVANNNSDKATAQVEVGSYLVLPETFEQDSSEGMLVFYTYGALIANAVFTVDSNNWVLLDCSVYSKNNSNYIAEYVFNSSVSDILKNEPTPASTLYRNREYVYYIGVVGANNRYVENYDDWSLKITLPLGLSFSDESGSAVNYLSPADGGYDTAEVVPTVGDKIVERDGSEKATFQIDEKNLIITNPKDDTIILAVGIKLSDNNDDITVGLTGNKIKSQLNFISDPYTSTPTIKQYEVEEVLITSGLKLSINNNSNDTSLGNGIFGLYTDENCTDESKIGELSTESDGTGEFKGIGDGNLYIKQIKAPSGYKIAKDIVKAEVNSSNLTDGYLQVNVINEKSGFLPSTGGLGTILYTTFGLLVIVVGSIAFISYRKKSQVN